MFGSLVTLSLVAPFAFAAVHQITVGSSSGSLTFSPEAIAADPGDQVTFTFQQKNHTASQSSFADPCGLKEGGFDSGFNPVAAGVTSGFPTFTIDVNDTTPIWVYCAQDAGLPNSHCGQGMVFAVNCGADGSANSFTNFKNSALAIGASLQAANASSSDSGYGSSTGAYGSPAPPPAASEPAAATPPTDSSSTPSPAVNAAAATHTVTVGANGALEYSPNNFAAAPGDVVLFEFQAKNHTVTQSSFPAPCEKLQFTTPNIGFDSGFMPVAANTTNFPTFSITVNDTTPIWVYCRQTNTVDHCGSGMVLGINSNETAGSTKTFADFQALAMSINGTASNSSSSAPSSGSNSSSSSGSSSPSGATSGSSPRYHVALPAALGIVGAVFALVL